tara:strand:- start:584 stop:1012 length:429 start_codon:yes stop_codon:yes gene_type:complete
MPSKKIRSRKKKGDVRTKSDVYKSLWKIGQEIGDPKPLMIKYMRHHKEFHGGLANAKRGIYNETMTKEFIDMEMDPIDKELIDKIKLYIDEVNLWREKSENIKCNIIFKRVTLKQVQLVSAYYYMLDIYNRQQAIDKILERF